MRLWKEDVSRWHVLLLVYIGAFCLVSRGRFERLYSVFNECSEELIVKSNFMFFFLYCVVFPSWLRMFFIIVFLSERQI